MKVGLCLLFAVSSLLLGACGEDAEELFNALTNGMEEETRGLTPTEANSYAYACSNLAYEANSYGIPTQLPQYFEAACLQNFIAKESPSAIVDEAARIGISSTIAEAEEYVSSYSESCSQNLSYARSLASSAPSLEAPAGYHAAINDIVNIINLQTPVISGTSIGTIMLDCDVAY